MVLVRLLVDDKKTRVVNATRKDYVFNGQGPLRIPERDEAEYLVAQGVAEIVSEDGESEESAEEPKTSSGSEVDEYEDMTHEELDALIEEQGLDVNVSLKKDEKVTAVREALTE